MIYRNIYSVYALNLSNIKIKWEIPQKIAKKGQGSVQFPHLGKKSSTGQPDHGSMN